MPKVTNVDVRRKLEILADAAKYDASCASSGSRRKNIGGVGNTEGMGICHSFTPDGRCVSLLKILLTNHCIFDCKYCINRISSDVTRARFTPREVVDLTLDFYRRNYIEGLFLSAGVLRTPDETMEEMIEVARSLRQDHRFGGYIHLKAVAGASPDAVSRAGEWADRVSANIELPTQTDLDSLAPAKRHDAIEDVMGDLRERIDEGKASKGRKPFAPAGQSTQVIVGATPSDDRVILTKSNQLYTQHRLRRVYYTAFSPIQRPDADLPAAPPPLVREHRLYQADWLIRFYGFGVDEIAPPEAPDLSLDKDPKLAWALRHRAFFPIDVNRAGREWLLRVPGLGVRNVERILKARVFRKLTLADLRKLRVPLKRAAFFLVTAEREGRDLAKRIDSLSLPTQMEMEL